MSRSALIHAEAFAATTLVDDIGINKPDLAINTFLDQIDLRPTNNRQAL
ncbi:MAG: hypothetical protein ACJATR_001886, partial [Halopseudomonas sp.]